MQSISKLKSWLSANAIALLASIAVLGGVLYATTRPAGLPDVNADDPAFARYVLAHTSGKISRIQPIRIEFASDFCDSSLNPIDWPAVLQFEPEIKGTFRWKSRTELEFVPSEKLPLQTQFVGSLELSKLKAGIPEKYRVFSFGFSTLAQQLELETISQEAIDNQSLMMQRVSGIFRAADVESNRGIELLAQARLNGTVCKIRWEHDSLNMSHRFFVDSLRRQEQEGKFELNWNLASLGGTQTGSKVLTIPSLENFSVLDAKVVEGDEQYISVTFSDPLLPNQDLNGLLRLGDLTDIRSAINRNEIRIYPANHLSGVYPLEVFTGIRNVADKPLSQAFSAELEFLDIKPEVRILGKGVILPNSDKLILPFEAVSLSAVDVEVTRIFENNVEQFLQVNNLDGNYQLHRVGRPIARKVIRLDANKALNLRKVNRFAVDLGTLVKAEPGAIYHVRFRIRKAYSLYRCTMANAEGEEEQTEEALASSESQESEGQESFDEEVYDEYPDDYEWDQRDNPCHSSYYIGERWPTRNVLASDLGIIAKKGLSKQWLFFVSDLKSAQAMPGVELQVLNFQKQVIASGKTDAEGGVRIKVPEQAWLLVARKGKQKGYLKLDPGNSLSLSRFDIEGEELKKGLKGFIYGERGVWRPGDSLFLNFILDDRISPLPKGHPVSLELFTPEGVLYQKSIRKSPVGNMYYFPMQTSPEAPTGLWEARVKAGGAVFTRSVRIENVQPNRLAIKLEFPDKFLKRGQPLKASLTSTWLHGAPARNLKADVEVAFTPSKTSFPGYKGFQFDFPKSGFSTENVHIFSGNLNENGQTTFDYNFKEGEGAPGMLTANLLSRVYETGGNYSVDRFSFPYHPYDSYFGLRIPGAGEKGQYLPVDSVHKIQVVAVRSDGKPDESQTEVRVRVYRLDWRFWWDKTWENLSYYVEDEYQQPVSEETISLQQGRGVFPFRIQYPNWGRYLVVVGDGAAGSHKAADVVFVDWPSWYGNSPKGGQDEATYLKLSANKDTCKVGENLTITIPSGKNGRALVSLENGSRVINAFWVPTQAGSTPFTIPVTKEMLPNVFVHVTVLQPHGQTHNHLPIRMYGILPIKVEDPSTRLKPVLKVPAVIRPEEKNTIQISEASGKAMTYTLAVVDEGLLGLTRFKTPDPHGSLYAREALGVRTWDLFDYVMGSFAVEADRIMTIGGDEGLDKKGGNRKANRFPPVVRYLGPFELKAGEKRTHSLKMGPYVGAVRLMVVASGPEGKLGSGEVSVPVRKPLMVLATLPRVVDLKEEFSVPATVFVMEPQVRNVQVKLEVNDVFEVLGPASSQMQFAQPGDQPASFRLRTRLKSGIGKVRLLVSSGKETARYEVEVEVRNANPIVTEVIPGNLSAGQSWSASIQPIGTQGTNSATLEVSSLPPMNLESRLSYLIHYPYGCVEQTTSSVFPQLALGGLVELDPARKKKVETNILAGINRLRSFQQSGGGFSYWPGNSREADDWGSSYAGHFLIEAKAMGYPVPQSMLDRWQKFQARETAGWVNETGESVSLQVYRLFTLSLNRTPDFGAMNRLRENPDLPIQSKWILAAAYAKAGQKEAALGLIKGLSRSLPSTQYEPETYGSGLRDMAFVLMTLQDCGLTNEAGKAMELICGQLSGSAFYSTQTTAMCLVSVARYANGFATSESGLNFQWKYASGKRESVQTKGRISLIPVTLASGQQKIQVWNLSGRQRLFVRVTLKGQPEQEDTREVASNLRLQIQYEDLSEKSLDVSQLVQGKEFRARVTVANASQARRRFPELALRQVFPSGWEIRNPRMEGFSLPSNASVCDYQDFRDDRVYTFFSLEPGAQKTFYILLQAAYLGEFKLPVSLVESMYENDVMARKSGGKVRVVPARPGA